jgi:hypothetical protein
VIENKDKKKNPKFKIKADEVVKAYVSDSTLKADPLGSYTGSPKNKSEKPEQDVDDI